MDRVRVRKHMPTSAQVERAFDAVIHSPFLLAPVVAIVMALVGALFAEIVVAVGWFTAGVEQTDVLTVGSAGLVVWIAGHGVPWQMAGVSVTLVPWGLALIPLLLGRLGGRWLTFAARTATPLRWWLAWILATAVYAGLVAVATIVVAVPTVHVSTVRALVMGAVVGGMGLLWGMRAHAPAMGFTPWIPVWLRIVVHGAVVAVAMLVGIAALTLAISAIGHFDDITRVGTALGTGSWGGAVVTVAQIAYVPTIVVWTVAYLVGAGVGLGPDVIMTPFLATSASVELPPIPLLALLPESSVALAWILPLVGVVAGLVSGIYIARGGEKEPRLMRLAMAVASSALAGVMVAGLSALARGSWGVEKLASWGPLPELTGSLAFVTVVVGTIATALTVRTSTFRRPTFTRGSTSTRHLVVVNDETIASEPADAELSTVDHSQVEGEHDSRE